MLSKCRTNFDSKDEFVKTVIRELLVVLSRLGAMTSADESAPFPASMPVHGFYDVPRLLGVILVILTTSGVMNSWKNVMTNTNTLRLMMGSCRTKSMA